MLVALLGALACRGDWTKATSPTPEFIFGFIFEFVFGFVFFLPSDFCFLQRSRKRAPPPQPQKHPAPQKEHSNSATHPWVKQSATRLIRNCPSHAHSSRCSPPSEDEQESRSENSPSKTQNLTLSLSFLPSNSPRKLRTRQRNTSHHQYAHLPRSRALQTPRAKLCRQSARHHIVDQQHRLPPHPISSPAEKNTPQHKQSPPRRKIAQRRSVTTPLQNIERNRQIPPPPDEAREQRSLIVQSSP